MRPRPLITTPRQHVSLRVAMVLMIYSDFPFLTPVGESVDHARPSDGVLQEAWHAIGDALTTFYSQTYPAHRPYGWWRFASPQARRPLSKGGVEVAPWWLSPHHDPDTETRVLECSCRFLRRIKALTPDELARAQATDWPGCKEENPDAWRRHVITLTDLRTWMQRAG